MPNQTTYMLSLDNDPMPGINSELVELSKNLSLVNDGFANLVNELNSQIIPAFDSIRGLFDTFKKYADISTNSFQHHFSSIISTTNSLQSSLTPSHGFGDFIQQPNPYHSLVQTGSTIAGGADNIYKLAKYAAGDNTAGEATAFGRGLSYTSDAFKAMSDFPGFLGDEAMDLAIGYTVIPELTVPLQLSMGALELIKSLEGGLTNYKSYYLLSPNEFQSVATPVPTNVEESNGNIPTLSWGQDNALFGPPSMVRDVPTINSSFLGVINQDLTRDALNTGIAANNQSQPINTNPCGCNTETLIITNNYNNLIGQLTITNSKLDMDLSQVKELVSEAIVQSLTQATKDSHIISSK